MDDHTQWARTLSVRDVRARLAEIISEAGAGSPTVITRGGTPVAAIVSMEELQLIEDAIDERLAGEAGEALSEYDEDPSSAVGMAQVLAELFDEELPGSSEQKKSA